MITTKRLRGIAGAAVALGLLAGITTAVPFRPIPAPNSGQPAVELTTATSAAPPTFAPVPGPVPGRFDAFPYGDKHSAFPTIARLDDGRFVAMWRRGSAHISDDGEILRSVSDTNAQNWSEPEHVTVDNGGDVRDPHLGPSGLASVGSDLFLTYFVSVNGSPTGARVARSTDGGATFEPSVRIDPNYPWAAISSPVVKVGTKLWTSFYAHQTTNTAEPESAYAAWSTDNGATWSSVRIAIGVTGNDFQEPWSVAGASNSVVFIMRDGTSKALASRNINSAGTWSPIYRNVLTNATGNSGSIRASNGKIYTVYRSTTTRDAMLASSADNGVTWTALRTLWEKPETAASTSVGMTYGHPFEPAPGYLGIIGGVEHGNNDSRIVIGYL